MKIKNHIGKDNEVPNKITRYERHDIKNSAIMYNLDLKKGYTK